MGDCPCGGLGAYGKLPTTRHQLKGLHLYEALAY